MRWLLFLSCLSLLLGACEQDKPVSCDTLCERAGQCATSIEKYLGTHHGMMFDETPFGTEDESSFPARKQRQKAFCMGNCNDPTRAKELARCGAIEDCEKLAKCLYEHLPKTPAPATPVKP